MFFKHLFLLICSSLLFTSCHKTEFTDGIVSDTSFKNQVPFGFNFPTSYLGLPSLNGIKILENGKIRAGNSIDRKKYFPILPFKVDMSWLGFIVENNPKPDSSYLTYVQQIVLLNNESAQINGFDMFYKFNGETFFIADKVEKPIDFTFAYGNFNGLNYYDNFININSYFFVWPCTKNPITPNEVLEFISNLDNLHYLIDDPINKPKVAIASYLIPFQKQKSNW